MSNNQSLKNIKKEIKSMASLLIFQESLIEGIMTEKNSDADASKKSKSQAIYQ